MIKNIVKNTVYFQNVYGLHLTWREHEMFSYLGIPRPNHGIMYIKDGIVTLTDKNETVYNFTKGCLLYIPSNIYYKAEFNKANGHTITSLINFSLINDTKDIDINSNISLICKDTPQEIVGLIDRIINSGVNRLNPFLEVMSNFYLLVDKIFHIEEQKELKNKDYSDITTGVQYLNDHLSEDISIAYLAKLCAMSETAFRRKFKSLMGISPIKYKNNAKIQKAIQLLGETDIPISEIANILGFYDSSYFFKRFFEIANMTPNECRKNSHQ